MDKKLEADLAANRPVRVRPLAVAAGYAPSTLYDAIAAGRLKVIELGPRAKRIPPAEARRLLGLDQTEAA